ncbi:glycoside hydrolase family 127 protein [Caldibacillus sp. 210928-DFI.2.22]|uniref:glycoside hydrolase family 127 protein n=1 Tax=unclassified Caldibacillus TaxID=2641266 RepID=UPI001D07257C|nr:MULTISPECIES: beta-L-arabinofuranosidase domain-containing protein [unclassified Caldibacillus]MCB7069773.1 glycoside hydrolase family 127 protein [Caldibacillus sp. 210928-DFI.2.22]MCB7073240.1 glycoside hydrolase family 127 protein [Caldibacillus sp. 210928-DFI.2.18]
MLSNNNIKITDQFWLNYINLVKTEVIPYQWKALNDRLPDTEPSHAIENFRIAAGEKEGKFYGMVFQDSDVAKWLEAVAYILEDEPNVELEKTADEVIDLIGRSQQPDGYINTYYTIKEPAKRWTNLRDNHELYCAGHLIEAAVAYYKTTGKRRFLDIMCRYADYIYHVFGNGVGQISGYPGHQEIELALLKLYEVTNDVKYLNLSKYFIDQRGKEPHYFDIEKEKRGEKLPYWYEYGYKYSQSHLPVKEQTEAVGHAVRAVYMYTAMADLAKKTKDEQLKVVCEKLWNNVTQKQMYITAGIGSSEYGESFTFDYDLPNDTSYTETCASVGLVFWGRKMLDLQIDRKYADVMERALYNGTISGMDLDGKKFFYVNPLEVWPKASKLDHNKKHVKPVRQKWFNCACCPPNLARMIGSIGHYVYSNDSSNIFTHLYIGNDSEIVLENQKVHLSQETNYPWTGEVKITVNPELEKEFTIAFRIPGWCDHVVVKVNGEEINLEGIVKKGYVYLTRIWNKGNTIELSFEMKVKCIRANPKVRENIGKLALQRGPIIYCIEEIDNGENLPSIYLARDSELRAKYEEDLLGGIVTITADAYRLNEETWGEELYLSQLPERKKVEIKAIPYYAWCNRDPGEMLVWINEEQ